MANISSSFSVNSRRIGRSAPGICFKLARSPTGAVGSPAGDFSTRFDRSSTFIAKHRFLAALKLWQFGEASWLGPEILMVREEPAMFSAAWELM